MSEGVLRQLLASFVIEVDKAGELAKGNAAIDAMRSRLGDLQVELNKVRAPAERAGKAIHEAFQKGWGSVPGLAEGMAQAAQNRAASLFGNFGAAQGLDRAEAMPLSGAMVGPTRETLDAARAATAQADAAAAKYATTLRGRLAAGVKAVRDGLGSGSAGGGEGGPGLIDRLATARNAFIGLAGGAVVTGIKRLVDGIGDIGEGAQRLGVSTDQFQRLRVLAEQNGTSVEALGTSFRNLSNAAVQPTKETTAAFKTLGVEVKDKVTGQFKSANDLFFDTTAALAGVSDETKRNALAQDLLGRSALELKPLFANGTAAVNEQRKALAELNVLSEETIKQADDVSDTWKKLPLLFMVAAQPLLKLLLPGLARFTELLVKGTDALGKFLKQTDFVSVALAGLASVMVIKLLPQLGAMVEKGGGAAKTLGELAGKGWKAYGAFVKLAIAFFAIEDFITFLRGGDSETGRLLDAIFGKGTAEGTQKTIQDLADAFKDLWKWMLGDGQGEKVKKLLQEIDDGINLIANDLLAKLGIGKGGLNGPIAIGEKKSFSGFFEDLGTKAFGNVPGTAAYAETHGNTMAGPALPPTGFYGPPTAGGSAQGNQTSFGDTNVTVTMGPSASAGDVGNAVVSAVTEERNRLVGQYGGF